MVAIRLTIFCGSFKLFTAMLNLTNNLEVSGSEVLLMHANYALRPPTEALTCRIKA